MDANKSFSDTMLLVDGWAGVGVSCWFGETASFKINKTNLLLFAIVFLCSWVALRGPDNHMPLLRELNVKLLVLTKRVLHRSLTAGDHVKSPLVIPAVSCALVTPVVVPVIKKRTTANGNVRTMANKPACSSWSIVKKRVCELFIFSVHFLKHR